MRLDAARYEELIQLLEKLRERSLGSPVLVEGRRDEEALRRLGVEGRIVRVKAGRAIYELCEELGARCSEVILMTDTDREGEKLARELKDRLGRLGVKVNGEFRRRLLAVLDTNEVENLDRRLEKAGAFFR